ncbi:MAG TPA: ABC transporter substrate-binding protein [Acetobacteraceae bacterium]|nr:ABC transporter substrate-binding protein [Acetobacteraceae bacterium]
MMRLWRFAATAVLLAAVAPVGDALAQTVKLGIIDSYSGPMAGVGEQLDRGIRLYMQEHEKDLPKGVKLEIIRRDDTGPNPAVAKRLATELITRDHVQLLGGAIFTPNALAIAPLATEAKVPFIIMNAGTSMITTKSPYIARVSFTLWQSSYPLAEWAAKHGIKTVYSVVSDYGPGIDAEQAFTKGFTDNGGQMLGTVRVPLENPDFVPFLQRAKDAKPNAVFSFVPAGKQATALMKAFGDLGLGAAGIRLIGTGDITTDEELQNMGDVALGVTTMFHYSAAGQRPANVAFVTAYKAMFGQNQEPSFEVVGAYDGMAAIFHVIDAQQGNIDPDKTMELLKGWRDDASPRGPIYIDPQTRDIVQNEYLRRVEKVNGQLENVELETIPMVKDPWKVLNHQN